MKVSVYDIILKAFFFNLMCKVVDYKDTSRILIDSIGTILGCQKPGKKCMWYQFSNSLLWDLQIKHYKIPRHPHRRNKTTMPVLPDFRNDPHSHCKILHISNRIHTKESFTEKLTLNSFKYQGPDKHLNEVAITSFQTNGELPSTTLTMDTRPIQGNWKVFSSTMSHLPILVRQREAGKGSISLDPDFKHRIPSEFLESTTNKEDKCSNILSIQNQAPLQ